MNWQATSLSGVFIDSAVVVIIIAVSTSTAPAFDVTLLLPRFFFSLRLVSCVTAPRILLVTSHVSPVTIVHILNVRLAFSIAPC